MKLYFHPAVNPNKIALFMIEAELDYELVPVDTMKGEQHSPEFRAINPNGKLPALLDGDVRVFDSAAILLYLAEKTGKFLPPADQRGELLSWLAWSVSGLAVYSGQYFHLRSFAANSEGTYALRRFEYETNRHWKVLDDHLEGRDFVVGDSYSIADMAMWGYTRMLPIVFGGDGEEKYPNIARLNGWINQRPAAAEILKLADEHASSGGMDDAAKKHLFAYAQPGDLVF